MSCSDVDLSSLAGPSFTRIWKWLDALPVTAEDMPPPDSDHLAERGEVDEWEAKELEFGESITIILELGLGDCKNPMREKIDEWARVGKELREGFVGGQSREV